MLGGRHALHKIRPDSAMGRLLAVSFLVIVLGGIGAGGTQPVQGQAQTTTSALRDSVSHKPLGRLLARHVDAEGDVDYAALKQQDADTLNRYLQRLATTDPSALGRDARLAFWINAYNAHTLRLILEHYPLQNIWGITPGPAEPKDNSPFDLEVGVVADTMRTLDEIEHEIIRPRFDAPRIHFALVCAAKSCPRLRRDAYVGPRLDAQLDAQAQSFLRHPRKNRIPADSATVALSSLFKWYGQDFGATPTAVQQALAPYFEGKPRNRLRRGGYAITHLPYDWTLNDQQLPWGASGTAPSPHDRAPHD
jgi:hypothetical protein